MSQMQIGEADRKEKFATDTTSNQRRYRPTGSASSPSFWLHATESGRPMYEKAGFIATSDEMELTW